MKTQIVDSAAASIEGICILIDVVVRTPTTDEQHVTKSGLFIGCIISRLRATRFRRLFFFFFILTFNPTFIHYSVAHGCSHLNDSSPSQPISFLLNSVHLSVCLPLNSELFWMCDNNRQQRDNNTKNKKRGTPSSSDKLIVGDNQSNGIIYSPSALLLFVCLSDLFVTIKRDKSTASSFTFTFPLN